MTDKTTAEREAFEAWINQQDQAEPEPDRTYELDEAGMNQLTEDCMWEAWQARASLPLPGAQEAADLPEALRIAAEAVKAWSNVDDFWALPDSDCGEMVLGAIEEGDKYELLTIDADTFGTDGESVKLAQFYAAANPGAVLALLDERDSLRAQLAALTAQAISAEPAPPADSVLYDPKAVLDVFNSARAGSEKPVGYLRGILAVIAHWESRPAPHRWMVPARADSVLEDAARLDWIAVHGSFGVDSATGEVGGNGQKRIAATRKNIDTARKQGGSDD